MSPSYPLFFRSDDGLWQQPIPIYLSAIFGALAPILVGAVDVVLIYVATSRLLKSRRMAVIAAAMLLLFPAHLIFSRQTVDAIYPLPFVIAWLIALLTFLDRPRPPQINTVKFHTWLLVVGGLCLGIGVYTQPSAPITMAAFLIVTFGTLLLEGHRQPAVFAATAAGFAVPLLLMAPWFAMHPETYQDTMGAWAIHKAHIRFPLDGVRAFLNWNTLGTRASLYWEVFNPSFLLFRDEGGTFSRMAPMLVAVAVLVPIGAKRLLTGNRAAVGFLLLAGLAVSPLAASTFGERHALHRALPMVVFLSLLATSGALQLIESRRAAVRFAGIALLVFIPLQYLFG